MNSLVKVFSNFKEFYSEINGATLTGAIDVVVVEQADGTFICSPFHVRFGKLGVLRSREKVVDIEVNGEPVDIHMKLGESGEAFFVEECPEDDLELLPANLVTSPIPPEFAIYDESSKEYSVEAGGESSQLVVPRRNSVTASIVDNDSERKYENQMSDLRQRRNTTDESLHRRNLSASRNELTTQQIRQEWAEHEQEQLLSGSQTSINWMSAAETISIDSLPAKAMSSPGEHMPTDSDNTPTEIQNEIVPLEKEEMVFPSECDKKCDDKKHNLPKSSSAPTSVATAEFAEVKEESKSKKKRRKKSQMKKKASQLNSQSTSIPSSASIPEACNETEPDLSSKNIDTIDTNEATHSSDSSSPKEDDIAAESLLTKNNQFTPSQITDFHFFSDGEVGTSPLRPSTPIKSDSELEMTHWTNKADESRMSSSASWKWGELPTPAHMDESNDAISEEAKQAQARHSMISNMFDFMRQSKKLRNKSQEGMYLSELEAEGLDPEVEALYFPQNSTMNPITPEDRESGNGTSIPHSPSSIESAAQVQMSMDSDFEEGKSEECKLSDKSDIALSLCGGLERGGPTNHEFNQNVIQYADVCQNPSIFSSPALVVRINGKYYNWETACPIVFTSLTYQKPLSTDAIDKLVKSTKTTPSDEQSPAAIGMKSDGTNNNRGYSWWYWRKSAGKRSDDLDGKSKNAIELQQQQLQEQQQSANATMSTEKSIDEVCEKYRKSLRLTSDQIESLNLKEGMNEVEFSVTTAYQGTSRCKCYLFRWKWDDKVVISDIDGTITKSDVLGHILPMVGKDWAHFGVAELFKKIQMNGYKILYLSARAIGQSRATREYLQSICQGDVKLPDGPLLLNPTSLISAFHREVIERKPEQFKIACLSDIKALFPQNPFYAGYGNRINDVWAYRAVGIPIMRIFTINPKGELKHELTQTLKSTYSSMTYIADQLFPPVNGTDGSIEFSNVNYWREPLPEIDETMIKTVKTDEQPAVNIPTSPKQ